MTAGTSKGVFANRLVGLIFVGLSFLFLSQVVPRMYQLHRLDGAVSHTSAKVTNLHSNAGHRGATYFVAYDYSAAGNVLHGQEAVSRLIYRYLQVGDNIPVIYVVNEPGVCRIDLPGVDSWEWHNAIVIGIFASVFLVIGAWMPFKTNAAADARQRWEARTR